MMSRLIQKLSYALITAILITSSYAYSQQITGTVQDDESNPIPGVTIIVEGTDVGTTSDFDGNFSVDASEGDNLTFSFIGFQTQTVPVSQDLMTIVMSSEDTRLDEIIITGLGTSVKRRNLANAVGSVSSEELVGKTNQGTVDGALYGKIPGVNITSSSGAPGGGFALRLRGISSINGNNQPLFILDGVYLNNNEIPSGLRFASGANRGSEENAPNRIADLDPNDIENIEVLKGASAAAIYGTRANAGVIIITTKKGRAGKTKINLTQNLGFAEISNRLGMRDWTAASVEAAFGAGEVAKYNAAIGSFGLIDYEDEIYGNKGIISDTKLSVSGGNEKTQFYVGTSYRDEEGIIKFTGFDRFSLRANIDHKISNTFEISSSSNFIQGQSRRSFTGNENEGGLSYGYTLAFTRPWINLYPDASGNYPNNPNYAGNPLFVRDKARNDDDNNRLIQSLKLTTKIIDNGKDRVRMVWSGGLDFLANETYVYVPENHQAQNGGDNGFIGVGKNNFKNYNLLGLGVWNRDALNGDLALTTQAGVSYLKRDADVVFNQATQLIPGQTTLGQGSAQAISQTQSEIEEFGYFGQIEGNYKDQIIATFGYRADKSSLNGDPNKFYGFPKASLAVNIQNFGDWNSSTIDQLKFRAAYGETGSSASFGSIFTSLNSVAIGGVGGSAIASLRGDANIEPETSQELEVGVDLRFLGKIGLELSYYNRNVKDLILSRSLPTSSGFSRETTNLADLANKGLEIGVNIDAYDNERFSWNSGIQFWLNRSEITRLDVPAFPQPGAGFGLGLGTFYIQEGQPVTQLAGNIGGVPTQIGNVEPDFQVSFNNNFTISKNLEIGFLIHLKQGGENINLSKLLTDLGGITADLDTPEGQTRASLGFVPQRFIEPAAYMRLREAGIYYNLPKDTFSWLSEDISNIKLGLTGRNLLTITDYSSYDPETSVNGGSGLSSGIEVTPYPNSKQYLFSLNVNF
jgi:TonB-linked SusC/RagA family outer membrane protein